MRTLNSFQRACEHVRHDTLIVKRLVVVVVFVSTTAGCYSRATHSHQLESVYRGEHVLEVMREFASSDSVRFEMRDNGGETIAAVIQVSMNDSVVKETYVDYPFRTDLIGVLIDSTAEYRALPYLSQTSHGIMRRMYATGKMYTITNYHTYDQSQNRLLPQFLRATDLLLRRYKRQ